MFSRLFFGIGLFLVMGCGKPNTSGEAGKALTSKEETNEVKMVWNGLIECGSSDMDPQLGVHFASDRRAVLFYDKGRVSVFPLGTLLPSGLIAFDEKEMKVGIGAESSFEPDGKPNDATRVMRVATSPTRWATVHASGFARIGEIEPSHMLKQVSFGSYAVEWQSTKPEADLASAPRYQDWATEFGGDVRLGTQAVQFVDDDRELSLLRLTGDGDCERVQFAWQSKADEASATKLRYAASRAEELDAPSGSKSSVRRIWLLAPGGQTVVEVGSKSCAIWSKDEKPLIVAYSPLPELSVARIGHDGTTLTVAGLEASTAAIDSGELPLHVRVASLAGGKGETVEVQGTLTIADREYQSIETLISPDKRFSIVNTRNGMPTVFDLKTKRQIKLEMSDELRGKIEARFPAPQGIPVSSPSGSVVGFANRFGAFSIGQFTVKPVKNASRSSDAYSRPQINLRQDGEAAAARAISEMRENQRRAVEQNSAP